MRKCLDPGGNALPLPKLLRRLLASWVVIVAGVLAGAGFGLWVTLATQKVYQASAQIFVAVSTASNGTQLEQGNVFTVSRVQSYTTIVTSPKVTGPVIQKLGLTLTDSQLASKLSADALPDTVLVNIHASADTAQLAAALANAVAERFTAVVESTEQTEAHGRPVVKLSVVHSADVPTAPIKPRAKANIGLGGVGGFTAAVLASSLRRRLDDKVHGAVDFEALELPVVGQIPFDNGTRAMPVAFRGDRHGVRADAFRAACMNLRFIDIDAAPRIFAVTSAMPGEGRSNAALNLAFGLAETGATVCLIEADLRRPSIAGSLGLADDVGFTTVLRGGTSIAAALQDAGQGVSVLAAGRSALSPSELLMSAHARRVVAEIGAATDFTVIDTAPLVLVADGAEVAALADATILIVRPGTTTRDQVRLSIDALAKVNIRPSGVIIAMMSRRRTNPKGTL